MGVWKTERKKEEPSDKIGGCQADLPSVVDTCWVLLNISESKGEIFTDSRQVDMKGLSACYELPKRGPL